ncbi:MAG: hypothetical protein ABIT20_02230 [Gemmatimonadaceae bacterium]
MKNVLMTLCGVLVATMVFAPMARPLTAQQVVFAANVPGELDSASAAAVAKEIARARERGLPVEPLMAKVREGRLKRAAGPRIRIAVIKLAERLDSARAALGGQSSLEELVAGADAIAAGAGETSLRTIRSATTKPLAAPIGTLAQLVASGVAPQRATEMIVTLIQRNASPAVLLALGNLVESDVASGLRAEESAIFRLRGIEGSLGLANDALMSAPTQGLGTNAGPVKSQPPAKRRP